MSFLTRHVRTLSVALVCLGAGAGAGAIASAGASTTSASHPATQSAKAHRSWARSAAARAVHGDLVVYTKKGFVTVTFDRGFVQSVSGNTLTLREGTKKATYKTVTLTLPSNAKVRNNRQASTLSALKPGERVTVLQAPSRTTVVARNAA